MKAKEIRELSIEQLHNKLQSLYKEESLVRIKIASNEHKRTTDMQLVKKTIARILTILKEKSEVAL